jgi:hypothetical protein
MGTRQPAKLDREEEENRLLSVAILEATDAGHLITSQQDELLGIMTTEGIDRCRDVFDAMMREDDPQEALIQEIIASTLDKGVIRDLVGDLQRTRDMVEVRAAFDALMRDPGADLVREIDESPLELPTKENFIEMVKGGGDIAKIRSTFEGFVEMVKIG